MPIVVDASIAMAWFLLDETSETAERALEAVEREGGVVPAVWLLEVANSLLVAERRGRIDAAGIARVPDWVERLGIRVVPSSRATAFGSVLDLAREHRLSAYDACYLELASRLGLPLATQDERLRRAAVAAGVTVAG